MEADDGNVLVLRFFEKLNFRSIGEAVGGSEDAARMRVNRALDKLQGLLWRQGAALSSAALTAVLLSTHKNSRGLQFELLDPLFREILSRPWTFGAR